MPAFSKRLEQRWVPWVNCKWPSAPHPLQLKPGCLREPRWARGMDSVHMSTLSPSLWIHMFIKEHNTGENNSWNVKKHSRVLQVLHLEPSPVEFWPPTTQGTASVAATTGWSTNYQTDGTVQHIPPFLNIQPRPTSLSLYKTTVSYHNEVYSSLLS